MLSISVFDQEGQADLDIVYSSKYFDNSLYEWILALNVHWNNLCAYEVAQSCPTLCDPVGCSLPGSSVHGILQARILEWVAISFSTDKV